MNKEVIARQWAQHKVRARLLAPCFKTFAAYLLIL